MNPKPFRCDRCDKAYKTKSHLNAHLASHALWEAGIFNSSLWIIVQEIQAGYCQAQVRSPKSKVPKLRPKGLGLTLKSHGPPPTPPPHNFKA